MISSSAFSAAWWRKTVRSLLPLAPEFAVPAILLTIANIVSVIAISRLQSLLKGDVFDGDVVSSAAMIGLVSVLVIVAMTLWGFGMWLLRLTAIARCRVVGKELNKSNFRRAMKELSGKKLYLSKVWVMTSLWLCMPLACLSLLVSLRVVASTNIASHTLGVALPDWSLICMNASILFLIILVSGFSFLALAVSASLSLSPSAVSRMSFDLLCRRTINVVLRTLIVLAISIVGSPYPLLSTMYGIPPDALPLPGQIALQIWLGISSAILWPLSVLPFCELVPTDLAR
jgi:hypothetical protein